MPPPAAGPAFQNSHPYFNAIKRNIIPAPHPGNRSSVAGPPARQVPVTKGPSHPALSVTDEGTELHQHTVVQVSAQPQRVEPAAVGPQPPAAAAAHPEPPPATNQPSLQHSAVPADGEYDQVAAADDEATSAAVGGVADAERALQHPASSAHVQQSSGPVLPPKTSVAKQSTAASRSLRPSKGAKSARATAQKPSPRVPQPAAQQPADSGGGASGDSSEPRAALKPALKRHPSPGTRSSVSFADSMPGGQAKAAAAKGSSPSKSQVAAAAAAAAGGTAVTNASVAPPDSQQKISVCSAVMWELMVLVSMRTVLSQAVSSMNQQFVGVLQQNVMQQLAAAAPEMLSALLAQLASGQATGAIAGTAEAAKRTATHSSLIQALQQKAAEAADASRDVPPSPTGSDLSDVVGGGSRIMSARMEQFVDGWQSKKGIARPNRLPREAAAPNRSSTTRQRRSKGADAGPKLPPPTQRSARSADNDAEALSVASVEDADVPVGVLPQPHVLRSSSIGYDEDIGEDIPDTFAKGNLLAFHSTKFGVFKCTLAAKLLHHRAMAGRVVALNTDVGVSMNFSVYCIGIYYTAIQNAAYARY